MKNYKYCRECKFSRYIKNFEKNSDSKDGYNNVCRDHIYNYNGKVDTFLTIEDFEDFDIIKIVDDIFNLSREDNDIKKTHDIKLVPRPFRSMVNEQRNLMAELKSI